MGFFKKKTKAAEVFVGNNSNMTEDLEAVMKKYDRESNTRIWEGVPKQIVRWVMALFSIYCIFVTLFFSGMKEITLTAFLALILVIGYLNYPLRKGKVRVNYMPWYDIIIMVVGAACFLYFAFNALDIIRLSTRIQPIQDKRLPAGF